MEKTIEQIFNDALIGKSIVTYGNKVGIIKAVKLNSNSTNSFGSLTVEVDGILKNHPIDSKYTTINFSDTALVEKNLSISLGTSINDIDNLSVRSYNVLRYYGLNSIQDIVNYKKTNENFDGMRNVGKKFREEIIGLLSRLKN
jgi:DNA-directed RNA polymerase alpha subunit